MSWNRFPQELQLEILETLRQSTTRRPWAIGSREHAYPISTYAVVSREWREFFEKSNFKNLILYHFDPPDFNRIVQGKRRMLVKWVWLRLQLPEYDCKQCGRPESTHEETLNNLIFTNMIWEVFVILASWGKKGEFQIGPGALTLELSAHSPTDPQHEFKELYNRMNDTAWKIQPRLHFNPTDTVHGWINGTRIRRLGDGALMRVFGHPSGLCFDFRAATAARIGALPKVRVVWRLVIRRQFYRHLSVSKALQPIIQSLTQLTDFIYEPWRGAVTASADGREIRSQEHQILFRDVFQYRRNLRRVSIFEDFNSLYYPMGTSLAKPDSLLGQSLAKSSQQFQELHVALCIDASDFLHAFKPWRNSKLQKGMEWRNLNYLSLTSLWLHPSHCHALIQMAAAAVHQMPNLKLMELWNSQDECSCIFSYEVVDDKPAIELKTTWHEDLTSQDIVLWQDVARGCSGQPVLKTTVIQLDPSIFTSRTRLLPLLKLATRILTDTSRYQLLEDSER